MSVLLFAAISAQELEKQEAEKIARSIFSAISGAGAGKGPVTYEFSEQISDSLGQPVIYIFSTKGAFLILSGEKRAYPLLAFGEPGDVHYGVSFSPDTSLWPDAFREWINRCAGEISFIRSKRLPPDKKTEMMWESLEEGIYPAPGGAKDVAPLLSTTWNQTCGYNALCPADPKGPCGRVVTGCVATAMAQVIRYNQHPVNGTGSYCYATSKYGQLCADFSTAGYNYALMTNNSGNAEVAKLMYHCGVSVSMNYGPSGSSAYSSSVAHAMRTWFGYTNGLILSKGGYPESNWERLLKNELHASRPIYYSGYGTSGHAFVLDGYKETNHFHVNWGWGGSYNGYFYLSSLNPGSMSFSSGQQGIVGMVPVSSFTGPDFGSAIPLSCRTKVSGNIADGNDCVNYYRNLYPATPGKELIYKFTTSLPGRVRIKITGQSESVYTFLLNHPHKDSLLVYGTNGLTAENTQPGTYYIAVEGVATSEPVFSIEVVCPDGNADLDIPSGSVSPRYLQSLQTNVRFISVIKNIGNSTADACLLEYFISSDNTLNTASDSLIGSTAIPSLSPGSASGLSSVLTMPPYLQPGSYYIIFTADRENSVPETDDENFFTYPVTVPEEGLLDCSSAISLTGDKWYHGNTATDGFNNVEKYGMGWEMTGPEVIHSFTPGFNGVVRITFIEKSPGIMSALILPVCNENTSEASLTVWNNLDTVITGEFYGVAGTSYILVVDGRNGASGEYSLKVELPRECPLIKIATWGKTNLCDGDRWPSFWTFWGHASYQWYRNGEPVPGAVSSTFSPSSPGDYHLVIKENGCSGTSGIISVRMDPSPDTLSIVCLGDSVFCSGGNVVLGLDSASSYPLNWARNGDLITGATGDTFTAEQSGEYTAWTANGACTVRSRNSVKVNAIPLPKKEGERLPIPSEKIMFHYPFTIDNNDVSGGSSMMTGYGYEPANDRNGGFWQARYLPGREIKVQSSLWDSLPGKFSLGLWFRTVSDSGGVISGFYDNPWGPKEMDALLYMGADGKLHFWISNGTSPVELVTSRSYNDDNWHCVVIRHSGRMVLETDSGAERITSAGTVLKKAIKGYWSFGGPSLPAGIPEMPPSLCWKGIIDDLILLGEDNNLLISYLSSDPVLTVTSSPEVVCNSGIVSFELPFSQSRAEYRVMDVTRSTWYSEMAAGTGGPVHIDGSYPVNSTTGFAIFATDSLTGCESRVSSITKAVDICTITDPNESNVLLKVYPVPAELYAIFESSEPLSEIRIYDSGGRLVHYNNKPEGTAVRTDLSGWLPGVYIFRVVTISGEVISGKLVISASHSL